VPIFSDVWLAAEGGLGGEFSSARVDAGFALSFEEAERETHYQLFAHLAEADSRHAPELGLVVDLNREIAPALWEGVNNGEADSIATVVQPLGQERVTQRCQAIADFSPVLQQGLSVAALWDEADAVLWCLELALRNPNGPGCAFISEPFVWNPQANPLPWTLLQPTSTVVDGHLGSSRTS